MDPENENLYTMHRVKEEVLHRRTRLQDVKILDTYQLGRVLVTDNKIQSAEVDEFIYHECLIHPAMVASSNPESVLVLGGGEGAPLREILKYGSIKQAVMVDLDEELISICRKYLPAWHQGAFDDPRVTLVYDDAADYVENCTESFDVVIMDISDPISGGPAELLYTYEFFVALKGLMREDSIFSVQSLDVYMNPSDLCSIILRTLRDVFTHVTLCIEYIPSFGSLWGFSFCSDSINVAELSGDAINANLKKQGVTDLRFYDGSTHYHLFNLPRNIREDIANQQRVSTKTNPLTINND
jgi:spermidine synthase